MEINQKNSFKSTVCLRFWNSKEFPGSETSLRVLNGFLKSGVNQISRDSPEIHEDFFSFQGWQRNPYRPQTQRNLKNYYSSFWYSGDYFWITKGLVCKWHIGESQTRATELRYLRWARQDPRKATLSDHRWTRKIFIYRGRQQGIFSIYGRTRREKYLPW